MFRWDQTVKVTIPKGVFLTIGENDGEEKQGMQEIQWKIS